MHAVIYFDLENQHPRARFKLVKSVILKQLAARGSIGWLTEGLS